MIDVHDWKHPSAHQTQSPVTTDTRPRGSHKQHQQWPHHSSGCLSPPCPVRGKHHLRTLGACFHRRWLLGSERSSLLSAM